MELRAEDDAEGGGAVAPGVADPALVEVRRGEVDVEAVLALPASGARSLQLLADLLEVGKPGLPLLRRRARPWS